MKVKLVKGMSYFDGEIRVTKENPCIEVPDEKVTSLISTGYFKAIDEPEALDPDVEDPEDEDFDEEEPEDDTEYIVEPVDFEKMTVPKLREYAAKNNIDISEAKNKTEIIVAIRNHEETPSIFTD